MEGLMDGLGLKRSRSAAAIPPPVDICPKYNHKRAPQKALVNRWLVELVG